MLGILGSVLVGIGMFAVIVYAWAYFVANAHLIKTAALVVALAYAAAGFTGVFDRDAVSACIRFGISGLYWWHWWRGGGDDDFRKRRRRIAAKVREVAGRLSVVPAGAPG